MIANSGIDAIMYFNTDNMKNSLHETVSLENIRELQKTQV